MRATRMGTSLFAVAALSLSLALVGSAGAQEYQQNHQNWVFGTAGLTTGLWNFDNSDNRYAASSALECGQDGSIWNRDFAPRRDISAETQFGLASSFGIPEMPDGDGGVMRFPAADYNMGYEMYPGIEANGGGVYVNQYTLIFDLLYPTEGRPYLEWLPLYQANDCNANDAEAYVNKNPPHGIWTFGNQP